MRPAPVTILVACALAVAGLGLGAVAAGGQAPLTGGVDPQTVAPVAPVTTEPVPDAGVTTPNTTPAPAPAPAPDDAAPSPGSSTGGDPDSVAPDELDAPTTSLLDPLDPPIGLALPSSLSLGALALGQQAAVTGTVTVTALSSWTLQVAAGSGDGHLVPDGCEAGATPPADRLWVQAQQIAAAPGSVAGVALSAADQQIAGGSGTITFPVTISQAVGPNEPLAAGCSYRATIVYTLVG